MKIDIIESIIDILSKMNIIVYSVGGFKEYIYQLSNFIKKITYLYMYIKFFNIIKVIKSKLLNKRLITAIICSLCHGP